MKKKVLPFSLLLCLLFCLACPTLADGDALLYDYEGLLTADEAQLIEQELQALSNEYNMTVAILTTPSFDSKTAEEYADDFYDENGLGMGEDNDGLILLVSMTERQWHISTCGYAIYAFPDYYLDTIGDGIVEYLSEGDCYSAFEAYIDGCGYYLAEDMEDEGYEDRREDYSDDMFYDFGDYYGEAEVSSGPQPIWIPIAIGIGLVIALIVMSIMKHGMKSVRMQSAAADYVRSGSFSLSDSRDVYLYTTVTKTAKPKDDDDDFNSGGFGAGGHFSGTHMSGGGAIHGGRGGSF